MRYYLFLFLITLSTCVLADNNNNNNNEEPLDEAEGEVHSEEIQVNPW